MLFLFLSLLVGSSPLWANPSSDTVPKVESLKVGRTLSDFTLTGLDGKQTQFSQLGAKVVFVNFWASWCPSCLTEFPSILSLAKKYESKGFKLIAVNKDEDPKVGVALASKKITVPKEIFTDTQDELVQRFGIESFPSTLILNRKGQILSLEFQNKDWDSPAVHKQIETWLGAVGEIHWLEWSDDIFDKASRENKLILLDLEAVWCHWCHVMDQKTYSDPRVVQIINTKYLPVKVDQDSRPDLSNRYQDFGWPATIILNSKKQEIAKKAGYIPSDVMTGILKRLSENPQPEKKEKIEQTQGAQHGLLLTHSLKHKLHEAYLGQYDWEEGGFGFSQKFLHVHSVELSLIEGYHGDHKGKRMSQQTLALQENLLDPVWGGMYQYSTHRGWKRPHFEKIMEMQTDNIRMYALAYSIWGTRKYLDVAKKIENYLETFLLSDQGGFFTSQDADLVRGQHSASYFKLKDVQRRKLGIPAIDQHQYARENGWVIFALVKLYEASGEERYLKLAEKTANWVIEHRALPEGGFEHDASSSAGPFLGDTLSMGRALLALYGATTESQWLKRSEASADFISKNFRNHEGLGFLTSKPNASGLRAKPDRDENVSLARYFNLLHHYTGKQEYRDLALAAMNYLALPHVAEALPTSGVLMADAEMQNEPVHIVVVGSKSDPAAKSLFSEALKFPGEYKRTEFWDPSGGPLPRQDIVYPQLQQPAAFACAKGTCSKPITLASSLRKQIEGLQNK